MLANRLTEILKSLRMMAKDGTGRINERQCLRDSSLCSWKWSFTA